MVALLILALQAADTAAFVTRLGHDTLAVERFNFDGHALDGVSVLRTPRVVRRTYHGSFGANGRPDSLVIKAGPVEGGAVQVTVFRYTDDSVVIEDRRDTTLRRRAFAVPGRPLPFSPDLMGPWEAALASTLTATTGDARMSLYASGATLTYAVHRAQADTFDLLIDDRDYGPLRARVDAAGRLQLLDFRATTDKYLAERVPALDVDALAADYAARERRGAGLGALSPRDTARGTVGAAHIMIDYGRPSLRGRRIFGDVVPWNAVWRTGANEATQLITDRDLLIGGTLVPAGTYSLFTLPSPTGWQLIVNRQHGQWGTDYDAAQDLARIPMTVRQLVDPVERLEIAVRGGSPGAIVIAWERHEASVRVEGR